MRPLIPGGIYHVFTHGLDDRCVFPSTKDRLRFVDLTATTVDVFGWRCYIETLLDTHYHILVQTPEPNLDVGMKFLNGTYSQLFNQDHDRRGHLWEARYNHRVVDTDEYFREVFRYIALNAVAAKKAKKAQDYIWCSYGATLGVRSRWPFIDADEVLALFGTDPATAIPALMEFVDDRQALREMAAQFERRLARKVAA